MGLKEYNARGIFHINSVKYRSGLCFCIYLPPSSVAGDSCSAMWSFSAASVVHPPEYHVEGYRSGVSKLVTDMLQ